MKGTYALLVTGLAAQQAAAHWDFFNNYGTPNYSKNECNDKQKGGFNWADLSDGDVVGNYGDFDFSGGWKCSNSFGKRDSLSKRSFGDKCIKNTVSKEKPASFGCSQRGFSITHMDISSEFDAELELHYKMEDGSTCKQRGSCSAGGSTLQNTQCGGAKSVEVYLGSHYQGDKDACEIGFHNIGFDCDAETPYTTPSVPEVPTTSSQVASSTSVAESTSPTPVSSTSSSCNGEECKSETPVTSTASACEGDSCYPASTPEASSSAIETPSTSANECGQYGGEGCNTPTETPASETPVSSAGPFTNSSMPAYTPPAYTPSEMPSSVVESTTVTPQPETSSAVNPPTEESSAAVPSCGYGQSCEESSVPSVSTATPQPESSTAVVPTTSESSAAAGCGYGESCESSTIVSYMTSSTGTPVPATSSAAAGCGYGQSCEESSAVVSSVASTTGTPLPATSSAAPQPSSPSYPPVDITDVVPKCMNSWLQISAPGCKDNTDSNCYCTKPEFTKNVIDCISARCGNDDEISKSLQYFIGICADHIPENPKIVDDCPSYIPLNPTPAAPTGGASSSTASSEVPEATESSSVAVPPAGGESSPAPAPSAPAETVSTAYGPGYPGETPAVPTEVATTPAGETPVASTIASSATITQVVGTTPAGETPAEQTPCTTITYGTTTFTVPQVHFTTQTNSAGANPTEPVALVPGTTPAQTPAETPAATTGGGAYAPAPYPTTMGTATVPFASGTGGVYPSSPAEFTGAASPFNIVPKGAMFGAVLAFFAL
ncbi:extracellular serine-threonine rich protein [Stemphylium lycopersici]|uniref:Extracellular serine-threonine rich protein n=1 Tax=Stemphylium lycopersici TaxID=183478 RepID=A0A364NG76_STELY|nr:extracellular serine-threonine rich protein [Stemphylium lycopersici]